MTQGRREDTDHGTVVDSSSSRPKSWSVPEGCPEAESRIGSSSRKPAEAPAGAAKPSLDILHTGDRDLVAAFGPCIIILAAKISSAGVDAIARAMARLRQRYSKMCVISVAEGRSEGGMDAECRARMVELLRAYSGSMSGSAVVCEGTGFRATVVRSIVTALHMASFASHPAKVFTKSEPALHWLASTQPEAAFDVSELAQSMVSCRERLQQRLMRTAAARAAARPEL